MQKEGRAGGRGGEGTLNINIFIAAFLWRHLHKNTKCFTCNVTAATEIQGISFKLYNMTNKIWMKTSWTLLVYHCGIS